MAELIKKWKLFRKTALGEVVLAILYALMLLLVLMYFSGNGQFIYEAF